MADIPVAVITVNTEDPSDPYYLWQELMTHIPKSERVTYAQWIRQELERDCG